MGNVALISSETSWLNATLILTCFLCLLAARLEEALSQANMAFTFIFTAEMIIKVIGLGPWKYVTDLWCVFDALVVAFSLVELISELMARSSASGLTALRWARGGLGGNNTDWTLLSASGLLLSMNSTQQTSLCIQAATSINTEMSAAHGQSVPACRSVRSLRVLRSVRVLRVMKMFKYLESLKMIAAVGHSLRSHEIYIPAL